MDDSLAPWEKLSNICAYLSYTQNVIKKHCPNMSKKKMYCDCCGLYYTRCSRQTKLFE